MKHKKIYRVITLLFVFVMLFLSVPATVFAGDASCVEKMNASDVCDDLAIMGIDTSKYVQDPSADYITIIDFLEYGYDFGGDTSRYALYLYIYNPSCREINVDSYKNTAQIQTSTVSGIGSGYRKYSLIYCDHSTEENEEFLYYKFKIDVPQSYMLKPTRVNRIYDIVDVELIYKGDTDANPYGSGGSWSYTGYQSYCGVDRTSSLSTLGYTYEELFTLNLELNPATWKTNTSEKGEGYRYELFSVYFSVPNWVIEEYGNKNDPLKGLYAVNGSYTEYKVNGVITPDETLYDTMLKYVGKDPEVYDVPFGFNTQAILADDSIPEYLDYGYNVDDFWFQLGNEYSCHNNLNSLNSVFLKTSDFLLGSEIEFLEAIEDLKEIRKFYSDRVSSYNKPFEVCSDDGNLKVALSSYISRMSSMSSWDRFWEKWNYGYTMDDSVELLENLKDPLVLVPEDISSKKIYSNIDNSDALYVSYDDYSKLETFVDSANEKNESTYLMRFALRDYYSSDIYIAQEGSGNDIGYGNGNYFFEKRIFEDVDILSLTWKDEGGDKRVVPVSATPITITGTPTAPGDTTAPEPDHKNNDNDSNGDFPWLAVIFGVVGIIVLIFLWRYFYYAFLSSEAISSRAEIRLKEKVKGKETRKTNRRSKK